MLICCSYCTSTSLLYISLFGTNGLMFVNDLIFYVTGMN